MNYTKEGIPLQNYSCGCYVAQWGDSSCGLEYCPKHKAAPDLYRELSSAVEILRRGGYQDDMPVLKPMLKALAKAEGKDK